MSKHRNALSRHPVLRWISQKPSGWNLDCFRGEFFTSAAGRDRKDSGYFRLLFWLSLPNLAFLAISAGFRRIK